MLQLEKVSRLLLAYLACREPLLPGKETVAFIGIDSMQNASTGTRSKARPSALRRSRGKSLLVRGLNAMAATISTPLAAPVIAGTRVRGGNAGSAGGAASLPRHRWPPPARPDAAGCWWRRRYSAFYSAFTGAVRAAEAFFSITVRMDPQGQGSDRGHPPDTAWTPIRYPRAIWGDQLRRWVSDAGVAEVPHTAVASQKGQAVKRQLDSEPAPDAKPAGSQTLE